MSDLDFMRATALALRDLAEGSGATEAMFTFEHAQLVWNVDDGFHLLWPDGATLEISDWVEHVDFVAAGDVESVRDQFVTRATAAGAE